MGSGTSHLPRSGLAVRAPSRKTFVARSNALSRYLQATIEALGGTCRPLHLRSSSGIITFWTQCLALRVRNDWWEASEAFLGDNQQRINKRWSHERGQVITPDSGSFRLSRGDGQWEKAEKKVIEFSQGLKNYRMIISFYHILSIHKHMNNICKKSLITSPLPMIFPS